MKESRHLRLDDDKLTDHLYHRGNLRKDRHWGGSRVFLYYVDGSGRHGGIVVL